MCLAIYKKADGIIPENHLKNGYESNPDGAGIAFPDGNGKVIVKKGMWTFEQFMAEYNQVKDKALLIHFRWSTCGKDGDVNCHPFSLNDEKHALIHNGHIAIKLHQDKSDTATFAHLVIEPLLKAGLSPAKPALVFLIEQTIGSGNKVAIMGADGEAVIYNAEKGNWEDNNKVWYSNTGYKDARIYSTNKHINSYTEEDWKDWYDKDKKKQGNNGSNTESSSNASRESVKPHETVNDADKFSEEIELEIHFCMDELSFTRQQAIDYLIYEGVLVKDDAGNVQESTSNHSVMGM